MNALAKVLLEGEVLSPRDTVRVVGKASPLSGARIARDLPAGLSISEILDEALVDHPNHRRRRDYAIYLAGHPIPAKNWDAVRPKRGTTVTFTPRLHGGNAVMRTVLSLVVAVAAFVFAGPIAGSLGLTIAGFALTGTALSLATAAVAAGIMLAGTLAINALFPIAKQAEPESIASSSLISIQGAQNQTNAFGAVPVVLGIHRQSPYFAAKPYTEIVGDDQYLRLLFCLGYGPLDITDIKIGETLLSSYSGVTTEIRQGYVGDPPITLYPGQVDEVALSIELNNAVDPAGVGGTGGYWQYQTSSPGSNEVSVDFTATEGCYAINTKTGAADDWRVPIRIQYRAVGAPTWIDLPEVNFTRSSSPARRGLNWAVDVGQYEVRCQKITGDGDPSKVKDKIVWSAIRSTKSAAPITFPKPLAVIAVRIKATDQLSGVVSTLNCICTSLVKAYRGGVWTDNLNSQYPHDLFRHVLQGPANARPVPDALIDIQGLQDWGNYCFANDFKYNKVINSSVSVYDQLCEIAAAGRAVVTHIDGKWGVIWDRPADPIVQHFTPRNSWGFQGQKPYTQQPHGWRVPFINEKNGYTSDERIVYDDGYSSANATLFEQLQLPGITDPSLIWRHGRFHIAQSRLRPEKISLSVGWEHLVCTRGDRVRVTHDVLLIGLAAGRVKSVAGQVVTFDELVTVEAGKTYSMQFRLPGASRSLDRSVDVSVSAGDYTSLTLVGDLSSVAAALAANSAPIFAFGETDRASANYRVQGITHQKDLIATLTLVDDAPDISTADSGAIPAYNPNVTIPADPYTLPPRDLKYAEVIDGNGATVRALVRLIWQVPRFGKIASFEVQQKDEDAVGPWSPAGTVQIPTTTIDVPLIAAGVWSFRVRCLFNDGTVSAWTTLSNLNLSGLSSAPDSIKNLHQHLVDGQTVLDWTPVNDPRILYYEVRKGTSWDTGLVVGDAVAQPPWPTTGDGTYHVRAFILSPFGVRIYSAVDASISISDSIVSRNIILSKDEQSLGWPGSLDGGVIDGSFIRTDIGQVIDLPFAAEVVDDLELSGLHIAVYVSPTVVDIGRAAECRFWTEYEASGVAQGSDFLSTTIEMPGTDDFLQVSGTRFVEAFPIWRFATEGSSDVFDPPDVTSPPDVFSAGVTWLDWVRIASGTRVSRFFQPGFVLISNQEDIDAVGTKFNWFVDVPDRQDSYTKLSVPDTGVSITFYPGGFDITPAGGQAATPFNGGPNGSTTPHITPAIVNPSNGDEVKITSLTLTGCTVQVVNGGVAVSRPNVSLLVLGY